MNTHIATLGLTIALAGLASSADAHSSKQPAPSIAAMNSQPVVSCRQDVVREPNPVGSYDALTNEFVTGFIRNHNP